MAIITELYILKQHTQIVRAFFSDMINSLLTLLIGITMTDDF